MLGVLAAPAARPVKPPPSVLTPELTRHHIVMTAQLAARPDGPQLATAGCAGGIRDVLSLQMPSPTLTTAISTSPGDWSGVGTLTRSPLVDHPHARRARRGHACEHVASLLDAHVP